MKRIAVEEHFATREYIDALVALLESGKDAEAKQMLERDAPFMRRDGREKRVGALMDLGENRLQELDARGIDMQVLSLISPGVQVFDAVTATALAKKINNELAENVRKHPRRYAGLACIAPQDPQGAAKELERAVKELGMKGASINSHTNGEYLDNKKYAVIFEKLQQLDVPLYIHPRLPSPQMMQPYIEYQGLDSAMLGFSHEVSLHSLRLVASGVFDAFPRLKIMIGHMGEAFPYWLWRIDNKAPASMTSRLKKKPSQYIKDNFYATTSGMFWLPPLICAHMTLGAERILFAVDYPLEENAPAVEMMNNAPISDLDKEKICHLNSEELLRL